MASIRTKTSYLQMHSPPTAEIPAPCPDVQVFRALKPSVEFYRQLYRGVGAELHWVDRLRMPDEELQGIVQDDRVDVLVLTVAGETMGYAELDRRQEGEIELAYFGLFPKAIGKGLGKFLLNYALRAAWDYGPRRVWVHTCDLDHPAALPNYRKAGFEVYDEVDVDQWLPDVEPRMDANGHE